MVTPRRAAQQHTHGRYHRSHQGKDTLTRQSSLVERTRRERLKSALNLRLKKRKTFFSKKLEILEKIFLKENVAQCRKKSKGGTL